MKIYRDILKKSWGILWRYYWLWPLGLLAALAGNGGEYNVLSLSQDQINNQATALQTLRQALRADQIKALWTSIIDTFTTSPITKIWLLVLIFGLFLVAVWIVIIAQAGLIQSAGNLDADKPANLKQALQVGHKKFWPIFWLNVLTRFISSLLLVVAFLPFLISFLASPSVGWNLTILLIISYVISIPLTIIISFVLRYAANYIVLENEPWWTALEKGLNLFFRNWLVSLETAAILFVINLLIGFTVFIITPNTIGLEVYVLLTNFNIITLLRLLPIFLIFIAVGMWFAVFQYVTWTLLFRRLRAGFVTSKIIRLKQELPGQLHNWLKRKSTTV